MTWTFHPGELDRADVQTLLALHFQAMRAQSPPSACHVLPADGLRAPNIAFWSLREGERLLGVGSLKTLDPAHGEIKSMRTAPEALGRGIGTALLRYPTAEASRRGMTRLSLETCSTAPFAAALRLYEREGFTACGPFGDYEPSSFTRFYTRLIG